MLERLEVGGNSFPATPAPSGIKVTGFRTNSFAAHLGVSENYLRDSYKDVILRKG